MANMIEVQLNNARELMRNHPLSFIAIVLGPILSHIDSLEAELKVAKEDEQHSYNLYKQAEQNAERLMDNIIQLQRELAEKESEEILIERYKKLCQEGFRHAADAILTTVKHLSPDSELLKKLQAINQVPF